LSPETARMQAFKKIPRFVGQVIGFRLKFDFRFETNITPELYLPATTTKSSSKKPLHPKSSSQNPPETPVIGVPSRKRKEATGPKRFHGSNHWKSAVRNLVSCHRSDHATVHVSESPSKFARVTNSPPFQSQIQVLATRETRPIPERFTPFEPDSFRIATEFGRVTHGTTRPFQNSTQRFRPTSETASGNEFSQSTWTSR
jgi:hypothetical protein